MISLKEEVPMTSTGLLPAFVSDYLTKDSLSRLYKYPFQFSSFKQIIEDKARDKTDRKVMVEVLKKQYAGFPFEKKVADNIELLSSQKTFTITTAHQPALFLGPLYFIYKISCAINVANQLKKEFPDNNFVPVFWLGSEDHDIDELNHIFIDGKRIEWTPEGKGAMGRLNTGSLKQVLSELNADSPVVSMLQKGMEQFETFGKLTQYFIHEIFKEHGLVVIDQDDVQLKKLFSEVIKDEVFNSRAVKTLKPNLDFISASYKLQANPRDINFFYLSENSRERIIFNTVAGDFEVNNTKLRFTEDEMAKEIENNSERFSPNVILRPLFQEMVLPSLAFVGGGGELSYWLELKPLFDHYGVNYPMQVLRNSASILNGSVEKKMQKLNLGVESFFADAEQLINQYTRQHSSSENLEEEKKKIEEVYASIEAKAGKADVTLKQSAAAEKQKALASIDHLENKMLKAEKKKQETAIGQIRNVYAHLFPEGTLQERRENFIPYYEPAFIDLCVNELNPFDRKFKFFKQNG